MAMIVLPSGKIVDTSHISYISRRSHTTDLDGSTHTHTTLHMDNNDLIRIEEADWDTLEPLLDWENATRPT